MRNIGHTGTFDKIEVSEKNIVFKKNLVVQQINTNNNVFDLFRKLTISTFLSGTARRVDFDVLEIVEIKVRYTLLKNK